jgi:uncharacterized protein (DUF1330 family)
VKTISTAILALLAGTSIGALGVQALHAQAKPPAYVVVEGDISDQQGFKEAATAAQQVIKNMGGRFLASATGTAKALKGEPPKARVVLIQWESMDQLDKWWNSSEWQNALKPVDQHSKLRFFGIEGMAP